MSTFRVKIKTDGADPRGCAIYVSDEPLNSSNYTNGLAVVWG